ncbi:MAG: hypothetical protein K6G42_00090 [Lachnospiraceae bacterium]|nr:hypothetical protein [Lachnospiraceae bacterium]
MNEPAGSPCSMIEIAYAIHDYFGDYYNYLGVSMFSVMENTEAPLLFHILCDPTLTPDARSELEQLCEGRGHQIRFYDIPEEDRISKVRLFQSGYTEGILYRLHLPGLLPDVSRIIYLDVDILANGDIRDLWEMDTGDVAAAGVWDPPLFGYKPVGKAERSSLLPMWEEVDWNEYINSGVLILNLDRIRNEHDLAEEAIDFWNTFGFAYPDQDAINYLLRGKKCLLPARFNAFSKYYPVVKEGMFYHYTYMAEDRERLSGVDRLYLSCYERSPFYKKDLDKKGKIQFLRKLKDHTEPYLRLLELTELNNDQITLLGWGLYLRGEYEQTIKLLSDSAYKKTETDEDPAAGEYIWELVKTGIIAKALHSLQRTEEAAERLEAVFTKAPEKELSYIGRNICEMQQSDLLGDLYYALGRYEEAEEAYLGAVYFETNEKRIQAITSLEHLIRCTLKAGKPSKARKYYCMLQSIYAEPELLRIYGLQIEIAEYRDKKKKQKEEK